MVVLAVVAGLIGIVARVALGRAAKATGRVDHYYWMLAADAYRTQRGFPVYLRGKYLMEDEAQGYPPLFGILLGRFGLHRRGMAAAVVLELLQIVVLGGLMAAFHASPAAIALGAAMYAITPVIVMYNTQLNSRILGDLFLFGAMAAEACAVFAATGVIERALLWGAAALLTALVIMTHKMTLQLQLVLLLPWSWTLHSVMPLVAFVAGLAAFVAIVGPSFALYQFRTHWSYVTFWNRHWPAIGAHQFRDSPAYGGSVVTAPGAFHRRGLRGVLRHLRVVASYAPANLLLPVASVMTSSRPPAWLLVWLGVVYAWAIATLVVPRLRCLGGGHLYIFNAAAPGACYVAWLPAGVWTTAILAVAIALNAVALFMAWRIVRARTWALDEMFERAVSALAALPKGRVAVFPTQAAEAVAWATHHSVLWGAHGYDISRMEGFFPLLTRPVSNYLREYNIGWVLSDDRFWKINGETLAHEGLGAGVEQTFGPWRLTECRVGRAS